MFDLDKFKSGITAYTRDGRKANFIGFCAGCQDSHRVIAHVEDLLVVSIFWPDGHHVKLSNGLPATSPLDLVRMAGKYDHINRGELVACWDDGIQQYQQGTSRAPFIRYFACANDNDYAHVSTSPDLSTGSYGVDHCYTIAEYAENFLGG